MKSTEVGFFLRKNKDICFLINVKHLLGIKTEHDDEIEMTDQVCIMILVYEHLYCIETPFGAIH